VLRAKTISPFASQSLPYDLSFFLINSFHLRGGQRTRGQNRYRRCRVTKRPCSKHWTSRLKWIWQKPAVVIQRDGCRYYQRHRSGLQLLALGLCCYTEVCRARDFVSLWFLTERLGMFQRICPIYECWRVVREENQPTATRANMTPARWDLEDALIEQDTEHHPTTEQRKNLFGICLIWVFA